jgi:predicted metal-dependent phosphoesterase TrpH
MRQETERVREGLEGKKGPEAKKVAELEKEIESTKAYYNKRIREIEEKASKAPAPKKAVTPGARATGPRRAAASKAAKEESVVDMDAFRRARAAGREQFESKRAAEAAREREEHMGRFRAARAAGKAQYESKKMDTFRDLRAKGREQFESKRSAASKPAVDQAAAVSEAQTLIAALRAMKLGK